MIRRACPALPAMGLALVMMAMAAGGLLGCEKVNHDNLDKWMTTEKGVGKLKSALHESDNNDDLRAHAAHNLIVHPQGHIVAVKDALDGMDERSRHALMGKLVPRLWDSATRGLTSEEQVPSALNVTAKDALFDLRSYASEDIRKVIDQNLIDWLSDYYEHRAQMGRNSGRMIVRELGASAEGALLEEARRILARPPDDSGARLKLGDELLAGLAWTGTAESAGFLMSLVSADYQDDTLPKRALAALHEAYVSPQAGMALPGRDSLSPHADALGDIARDENLPGVMNNDAVDLLAAAGAPACIEPLAKMAAMPAAQRAFRWAGIQRGIRCAGAQGLVQLVEALPRNEQYERAILQKYVWDEILDSPGKGKVAEQLRRLLESDSPIARVTAIEVLGQMAQNGKDRQDVERIRKLARDRAKLTGWWGEQANVPKAKRKKDPTVGQIAVEVAQKVEGLAKGPKTK